MNIAIVSPYSLDRHGGVQDQARLLQRWLTGAGHRAWIVAPGSGDGWFQAGNAISLPANRSMAPVALSRRAVSAALEATADADVVHVHEPLMPAVSVGLVLRCRRPLVGTFHADPSRLIRGAYRLGAKPLQRLMSRLQVVTAVSDVAAGAVSRFADPRVIPNGLDVAAFNLDESRRANRVVFIGRDETRKGLDVLLAAWEVVVAGRPDAELIVVSETSREPAHGVQYVGSVPEAEKRRLLASSAVLCAPNIGGESFGLVVTEGMAAGCAVVASGLPAFVAVLGDAGSYAKPGDAGDLARQLEAMLSDERVAATTGQRARDRVKMFDVGAIGAQYLEAYGDATAAFERTAER